MHLSEFRWKPFVSLKLSSNPGRRFLVQANARELAAVLPTMTWQSAVSRLCVSGHLPPAERFQVQCPSAEVHMGSRFLVDWFTLNWVGGSDCEGLRLCSNSGCERPETRRHEFRRCSV